jgi:hypothetical protein
VEFCEAFVGKAVADTGEEEPTSGLGIEESLILCGREIEVAIDIAGFTETHIQDLLLFVVRSGLEDFRIERQPRHSSSPCLILNRVHDCGIVGTMSIEVISSVMPLRPSPALLGTDSTAGVRRSG